MSYTFYHILHLLGAFLLVAYTYTIFANPNPETKRRMLMLTGILSLVMLITGFGLLARLGMASGMPGWSWVKIVCWLALSALGGVSYRFQGKIPLFEKIALGAIVLAILMVTLKPF